MPEFLVNYRNSLTNALVNVHIINVDDEHAAIKLADNSLLDDEYYYYESVTEITDQESHSLDSLI